MDRRALRVLGILASGLASCVLAAVYAETTVSELLDFMIKLLNYSGTAIFAATGALAASKKRIDFFRVVMLGCVTALGGGTLRDIILNIHPVFWISDVNYLLIALMAAVVTFSPSRYLRLPVTILTYVDAIGIGYFTVIGFQIGFQQTQLHSIGILMGVMTSLGGGMIRDLLLGDIPLILRRPSYVSASLCGAMLYGLLLSFQVVEGLSMFAAVMATLGFGLAALRRPLSRPGMRLKTRRKSSRQQVYSSKFYSPLYTRKSDVLPQRGSVVQKN